MVLVKGLREQELDVQGHIRNHRAYFSLRLKRSMFQSSHIFFKCLRAVILKAWCPGQQSASPGNMMKIGILRPHCTSTKSEVQGGNHSNLCFNKEILMQMSVKSDNHWIKVYLFSSLQISLMKELIYGINSPIWYGPFIYSFTLYCWALSQMSLYFILILILCDVLIPLYREATEVQRC